MSAGESFAAVLYGAVACDGTVSQAEAIALTHALFGTALFRGLSEGQMRVILGRIRELHKSEGLDGLLKHAAPGVPPDLRETAFAHAVDLVLSDDEVTEAELAFLKKAQGALGVADAAALKIVEVVRILNKA
jgi:tellurite resistance protein TerB